MRAERNEAGFTAAATKAALALRAAKNVLVVGHNDADGLSSTAIASISLERAGVPHRTENVKKLDQVTLNQLNHAPEDMIWLVDLGSGYINSITRPSVVIADHHMPEPNAGTGRTLESFDLYHINPHLYGLNGSQEISGAGVTYTIAKAMDQDNKDLAVLAIIGAVGDFQENQDARLIGFNRTILKDAVSSGRLRCVEDLRLFGRCSRPIAKMFEFANDPVLPGMTGDFSRCSLMLYELEIIPKHNGRWRCWEDLEPWERSAIIGYIDDRYSHDPSLRDRIMTRLVGEVYNMVDEDIPELGSAKEFATLLNACGRYGEQDQSNFEVALQVMKGDRDLGLMRALRHQANHRRNLASGIDLVLNDIGVETRECYTFFDAGSRIPDTIVGIVAGMVLGSGKIPDDRPIVAMADSENDEVKVSARGTKDLVAKGLDLSHVMRFCAATVGGAGGGHDIAAGATVPAEDREIFLDQVNSVIKFQLNP